MPLCNPYADVDWARPGLCGNLHAHSTQSDGRGSPQQMLNAYARAGHGFAMLSDHDRWTPAEQLAGLDAQGMILLPGQEVTRDGGHLLQVGGSAPVTTEADRQRVLDGIAAAGGMAVLNHPNWYKENDHWTQEQLMQLRGYAGIEVVNAVIDEMEGDSQAFNRWDRLLGHGRRVWGFANDDAHGVEQTGQAWNVAYPPSADAGGVIAALTAGRFYASTGLSLDAIIVEGECVEVRCPGAERIVAIADWGRRVAQADGGRLRAHLPAAATYLRFACLGRGESNAWTQPFFRC